MRNTILVIAVWMFNLPAVWATLVCPRECSCVFSNPSHTSQGLHVLCTSASVPHDIPDIATRLQINGLSLDELPNHSFINLTSLSYLVLSGDHVTRILDYSFTGLASLQTLVMEDIGIEEIAAGAFVPLISIKYISLNGNRNIGLYAAGYSFLGLYNSSIETLHADKINRKDFILDKRFFRYFEKTKIKTITLSDNQIAIVEPGLLRYVFHLEKLILSENFIVGKRTAMVELMLFRELRYLDISFQRSRPTVKHKRSIADETIGNHVKVIGSQDAHNLMTNPITDIDNPCKDEFICPFPPKLEYLYIQYFSRGPRSLHKACFNPKNMLKELDVSGNILTDVYGPFIGFNYLEYINMENCESQNLASNVFEYYPALKVLKLGYNQLTAFIQGDVNGTIFRKNYNLQVLDLKNNGIEHLPPKFIETISHVNVFDLSRNNLSEIHDMGAFRNLSSLNLTSNNISHFTKAELEILDGISSNSNISVFLADNPVTVSSHCCDIQDLISWTMKTTVHMPDLPKYVCLSPSGYRRFFNTETIESMHRLCETMKLNPLSIVIAISSVIFLMIVVASVMYRKRWKMRWLMLASRRFLRLQEESEDSTIYDYDAFVSFNVDDIKWIKDYLIVELEQIRQLRLCIHHRDFMPGIPIEENIVDAIERSRKTILILSANFVKSNWCHFEVQMARNKLIEKGYDIIVPVIIEDFDLNLTSRTLRNILDRNTYLVWERDDDESHEHFWAMLSEVITGKSRNVLLED